MQVRAQIAAIAGDKAADAIGAIIRGAKSYYSAQILFFGAEFTQVPAVRHGRVRPRRGACFLSDTMRIHQGIAHSKDSRRNLQRGKDCVVRTVYLPSSDGSIANQKEQRKQDHQPVQLAIFTGDEA